MAQNRLLPVVTARLTQFLIGLQEEFDNQSISIKPVAMDFWSGGTTVFSLNGLAREIISKFGCCAETFFTFHCSIIRIT